MTFSSANSTNSQFLKMSNLFAIIFKKDKAFRNGFLIVFGSLEIQLTSLLNPRLKEQKLKEENC